MSDKRRAHGLAFQNWIKNWIEEYIPHAVVHNQPLNHVCIGKGKWICKSNDIFGCIDLIVMTGSTPLFIQATLDRNMSRKLEALKAVPWNLRLMDVQVWVKRSPTRVSIKKLTEPTLGVFELADKGVINRRKYVDRPEP